MCAIRNRRTRTRSSLRRTKGVHRQWTTVESWRLHRPRLRRGRLTLSKSLQSPSHLRDRQLYTAHRGPRFNTFSRARRASHTLHKGAHMPRQYSQRLTRTGVKECQRQGDRLFAMGAATGGTFAGTALIRHHEGQADQGAEAATRPLRQERTGKRMPAEPDSSDPRRAHTSR